MAQLADDSSGVLFFRGHLRDGSRPTGFLVDRISQNRTTQALWAARDGFCNGILWMPTRGPTKELGVLFHSASQAPTKWNAPAVNHIVTETYGLPRTFIKSDTCQGFARNRLMPRAANSLRRS